MTALISAVKRHPTMNDIPYFRVTSLKTFEECPHTWAAQYTQVGGEQDREGGVYSKIGRAVHKICEDALMQIYAEGYDPEDQSGNWATVPEGEQANLMKYLQTLTELPVTTALSIEERWRLQMRDDAPPISGSCDFVGIMNNTDKPTILILDHKSNRSFNGKDWWAAQLQPMFYAWAARMEYPGYEVVFRIGYPNLGTYVQWKTDPDDDGPLRNRFNSIWTRMVKYHESGDWPQTLNDSCGYCPLKSTCSEHGKALSEFKESFFSRVGASGVLEQLEFVKTVEKAVKIKRDELEAEAKEQIKAAGGSLRSEGKVWTLEFSETRKAKFLETWAAINNTVAAKAAEDNFAFDRQELTKIAFDMLDDIFTVKVGGLDKLAEAHEAFADIASVAVKTPSAEPTLKAVNRKASLDVKKDF